MPSDQISNQPYVRDLSPEAPGIIGLMMKFPVTGAALNHLAHAMLAEDHPTLARGERELIAAYVSQLNDCEF